MKVPQDTLSLPVKLVRALNGLLNTGNWDATLYLRTAKKHLEVLRNKASNKLFELVNLMDPEAKVQLEKRVRQGYQKVFVSLYQADGKDMKKWKQVLRTLTTHSTTRPIYKDEAHIQELIRAKMDKLSEAYAMVEIREIDILPAYHRQYTKDRFDHDLLSIREGAIRPENILEFVHDGKHYGFNGELTLKV